MAVQWVQLAADETLVASDRAAWLQRPEPGALALSGDMPHSVVGTVDSTRHLLDGAIAAAERAAPAAPRPAMTQTWWSWQLIGQWYTAHHSVALLPDLVDRFERAGRVDLADFTRMKLREEQGHDEFSLADLRAIGFDATALVKAVGVPSAVEALVGYARACTASQHPVAFLGYAYALERRVIRVTPEMIRSIDVLFEPGVDATSGLRAHAGELDPAHVEEFVAFVAALPAHDRVQIARSCFHTTTLGCRLALRGEPSDAALERRLRPFRSTPAAVHPTPPTETQRGEDR